MLASSEPWQEPVSERRPQSNAAVVALGKGAHKSNEKPRRVSGWMDGDFSETKSIWMRRLEARLTLTHSTVAFPSSDAALLSHKLYKVRKTNVHEN